MAIIGQKIVYYKQLPDDCGKIGLRWINSKGGTSIWVFTYENRKGVEYNRGDVFQRIVSDYSDGSNLFASIQHGISDRMTVTANNLELQEAKAIEFLGASPKVWEIFQNDDGTFKYIEVEVVSVDSEFATTDQLADVVVSFRRPQKPFY